VLEVVSPTGIHFPWGIASRTARSPNRRFSWWPIAIPTGRLTAVHAATTARIITPLAFPTPSEAMWMPRQSPQIRNMLETDSTGCISIEIAVFPYSGVLVSKHMFESIAVGIKEVAAVDTASLSPAEYGAAMVELAAHTEALAAAVARLARGAELQRAYGLEG